MKFNIVDDTYSLGKDDSITDDGTAVNAKGGTEMMREALYKHVDNDLLNQVQIISSRVRKIDPDKPTILWLHDTYQDPEVENLHDPEYRKQFETLVFVSHHQQSTYNVALGIPYDDGVVVKNAIDPIPEHEKPSLDDGPINLIYHTTPHRGLELAYYAVDKLSEIHGDTINLDVYSSFKIYGWDQRDEPFKDLFKKIEDHPNMTYHGYQPNSVVRKALQKAHIFAYPNIWYETSCIAAIEALSAGCFAVLPSYGALPETCANWAHMHPYTEDIQAHLNLFANSLNHVINSYKQSEIPLHRMQSQSIYYRNFYSWGIRSHEWSNLIRAVIQTYNEKKSS